MAHEQHESLLMAEDRDPDDAVDYLLKNATKFAQAKANRVYLEEFRKSKKALLMGQSSEPTAAAREQFAYSHAEYVQLLQALQEAVEVEESLRWHMEAARMRVEIWRTRQANNRMIERTTQ